MDNKILNKSQLWREEFSESSQAPGGRKQWFVGWDGHRLTRLPAQDGRHISTQVRISNVLWSYVLAFSLSLMTYMVGKCPDQGDFEAFTC